MRLCTYNQTVGLNRGRLSMIWQPWRSTAAAVVWATNHPIKTTANADVVFHVPRFIANVTIPVRADRPLRPPTHTPLQKGGGGDGGGEQSNFDPLKSPDESHKRATHARSNWKPSMADDEDSRLRPTVTIVTYCRPPMCMSNVKSSLAESSESNEQKQCGKCEKTEKTKRRRPVGWLKCTGQTINCFLASMNTRMTIINKITKVVNKNSWNTKRCCKLISIVVSYSCLVDRQPSVHFQFI